MADFNTLNEAHVADARATVIEAVKGLRSGDLPSDRAHPPGAPGGSSLAAAARRRASIGDLEDEQSAPVELVAPDVI